MHRPPKTSRRWQAFAIPLAAIILFSIFMFLVRSGEDTRALTPTRQADAAAATPTPTSAGTPTQVVSPSAVPIASVSTPIAPPPVDDDIVAVVGGVALSRQELDAALAIDRVMAGLAGQLPSSPASVLEQWINTELVLQRSGAPLDPAMATARLDAFLSEYGQSRAALVGELAARNITQATFDAYFVRLVAADAYLRTQTAATGSSSSALIKAWQREAQISFGPVANVILGASAAPTPTLIGVAAAATPTPEAGATAGDAAASAPPATLDPNEPRGTEIGQLAPDFALSIAGEPGLQYSLRNLLDRPSVLIFWTTWCPYCLRQTPVLVEAHRQWGEEIQFVGVNVAEDVSAVTPYIAEHAIAYPVLLDSDGATAGAYAVQGYPTTYFLDANTRIVARHVGALTEEELNNYLQMLRPVE